MTTIVRWAVTKSEAAEGRNESEIKFSRDLFGAIAFCVTFVALFWIMPYIMYPFVVLRDLMWAE